MGFDEVYYQIGSFILWLCFLQSMLEQIRAKNIFQKFDRI